MKDILGGYSIRIPLWYGQIMLKYGNTAVLFSERYSKGCWSRSLGPFRITARRYRKPTYTEPRDGFERTCERLIDKAGRQKVFDRARALGWSASNNPPVYVWAQIAHDIIVEERHSVDS